jgi:hypothetical protein
MILSNSIKIQSSFDHRNVIFPSCCLFTCVVEKLGMIVPDEENPSAYRLDMKGFVYSFLLSVGNDTIWQGVIETSAQKCFDQFNGSGEGTNKGCEGLTDLD